jgi:hypothetical protein
MNSYPTADQSQEDYVQRMGEALGRLFGTLWRDLAWLHVKWSEYVELFGTSAERVELLNRAAPNFFGIIQGVLIKDIMLHIARLTDSEKSGGRENLTILVLPGSVARDLKSSIQRLVAEAKGKTLFCRDWRNRRIAHTDRALSLTPELSKPLDEATREKLQEALRAIGNVLNAASEHYGCSPIVFEETIPALGGAGLLIEVIARGTKKRT